ncbi:MAG: GNAT family N-acetyltransferase [Chloroflexi bacterium]|nr:GNAT family N-acetyltransferase [Chloroflexota bacterium]
MTATPLRIEPAIEADRPGWDAFVAARSEGDVLQLWAWGAVASTTGERPVRIAARGADGGIRGLAQALVRSTTLGRSIVYVPHGPLWDRSAPDAPVVLAVLLGGLRDLARRERGIVVKVDPRASGADAPALARALQAAGLRRARFDLQARLTQTAAISPDPDERLAAWTSNARNLARRAAREGTRVEVWRVPDAAAIGAFAELHARTASRGGFRAHSAAFLGKLAAALTPPGGWYLVSAQAGGRLVAGMVVARVGDRAYYFYGATDRDAPRNSNGAYAAMAATFEALADDGVRTFDLWGVDDPDDPRQDPTWAGFGAFKRRFGGEDLRHPGTFDLVVDRGWWLIRDLRERLAARR